MGKNEDVLFELLSKMMPPKMRDLDGKIFHSDKERLGFVFELGKHPALYKVEVSFINKNAKSKKNSDFVIPDNMYLKTYSSSVKEKTTYSIPGGRSLTHEPFTTREEFYQAWKNCKEPPLSIVFALDPEDKMRVTLEDNNVFLDTPEAAKELNFMTKNGFLESLHFNDVAAEEKCNAVIKECILKAKSLM